MMYRPEASYSASFTTVDPDTGDLANADSTPTAMLRRNGADTAEPVTIANHGPGDYTASGTLPDWDGQDTVELIVAAAVNGVAGKIVIGLGTLLVSVPATDHEGEHIAKQSLLVTVNSKAASIDNRLPASPAAVGSEMTLAESAITAAKIAASALQAIAIAVELEFVSDATGEEAKRLLAERIAQQVADDFPDLGELELAAIANAVWAATQRHITGGTVDTVTNPVETDTASRVASRADTSGLATPDDIPTAQQIRAAIEAGELSKIPRKGAGAMKYLNVNSGANEDVEITDADG